MPKHTQSARGALIARRTYCRPVEGAGQFETWEQVVTRVVGHQQWLWESAQNAPLHAAQRDELQELGDLMRNYEGMLAGRTLWLGGTAISRVRTASTLNCTHKNIRSVHDVVDLFWLLLQGAGTGFTPESGTLNGFANPMKVEVLRSERTVEQYENGDRGCDRNTERFADGVWSIEVGDSAAAWAKLIGKILAGKYPAHTLLIDMRNIRAKGVRLKGYGWISSGDAPLTRAMLGICQVMNRRAGQLLTKMDLLDIINWLGTTLSSRRSAQIALVDAHDAEAEEFANAKKDYWSTGNDHRASSNNSLVFWHKPSKAELRGIFAAMMDAGGSEPGFINGVAAKKRAPWFSGVNPCAEQLLGDGGVCNLSEVVLPRFNGRFNELLRAVTLIARANYRQTCIDMDDGILQRTWHELNQFLHLCGVGVTGVVQWDLHRSADAWRLLRATATEAANAMADELGQPHPKHVTTLKPSGCRPAHALTTTAQGVVTLDELFTGHSDGAQWWPVAGYDAVQGASTNKITQSFDNGEAEVFAVRMAYGAEVEATGNHPWFVVGRGWVPTAALQVGDVIETNLGAYQASHAAPLKHVPAPAFKMRGDATVLPRQPAAMTSDLAWLLGFLWGGGCCTPAKWRVRFTDGERGTLERVAAVMAAEFGLSGTIAQSRGRNAYTLDFASAHLYQWFVANGFWKAYSADLDRLPLAVRTSAASHIRAFIAGICDADANIAKQAKRKGVVFSTASEAFAKHLQGVAAAVGLVFGRSHNTKGSNLQQVKSMWLMTLGGRTLTAAGQEFQALSLKCQRVDAAHPDVAWPWTHPVRAMSTNELGRVAAVRSVGVQPTFDVEVANEHWFYDSIYRSHNTLSKLCDVSEGIHAPLGRYIFNNTNFSASDPLLSKLRAANYLVTPSPIDPEAVLVRFPVEFPGAELVNTEPAVSQLERYKLLMLNYVDSNASNTISYSPDEVPAIVEWLHANWDVYVGVSFIYRTDPTKTAQDLGYAYLPQEVVTEEVFRAYADTLLPVDLAADTGDELIDAGCAGGACPIR